MEKEMGMPIGSLGEALEALNGVARSLEAAAFAGAGSQEAKRVDARAAAGILELGHAERYGLGLGQGAGGALAHNMAQVRRAAMDALLWMARLGCVAAMEQAGRLGWYGACPERGHGCAARMVGELDMARPGAAACVLALEAAGVPLFELGKDGAAQPISRAIKAGEEGLALKMLDSLKKMIEQGVEGAWEALGDVAEHCQVDDPERKALSMHPMLRKLALSEPKLWAGARRGLRGREMTPLLAAFEACDGEVAAALMEASPAGCLAGCMDGEGFPWEAALRFGSKDPKYAFESLLWMGADPLAVSSGGDSALGAVAEWVAGPKSRRELAGRLMELGADPRAKDGRGMTPIGKALRSWSVEDVKSVLGAGPEDVLEAMESADAHKGLAVFNPLCWARYSGGWERGIVDGDGGVLARARVHANDVRARDILACANGAGGGLPLEKLERSAKLAGRMGLPESFEFLAKAMLAKGGKMEPQLCGWLATEVDWGPDQEEMMCKCVGIAARLGMEVDGRIGSEGSRRRPATLLGRVMERVAESDSASGGGMVAMLGRARALVELGADPAGADGAPIWEGKRWAAVSPRGRSGLMELAALAERMKLAVLVPSPATSPGKVRSGL